MYICVDDNTEIEMGYFDRDGDFTRTYIKYDDLLEWVDNFENLDMYRNEVNKIAKELLYDKKSAIFKIVEDARSKIKSKKAEIKELEKELQRLEILSVE